MAESNETDSFGTDSDTEIANLSAEMDQSPKHISLKEKSRSVSFYDRVKRSNSIIGGIPSVPDTKQGMLSAMISTIDTH